MKSRSLAGFLVLAVVAAVLTLSCSLDYRLDWQITDLWKDVDGMTVHVDYRLSNSGARRMDSAMIHFVVSAQLGSGLSSLDAWTAGVDLAPFAEHEDTLSFTFAETIIGEYTAEVIGAGWDEHSSSD